MLLCSQMKNFKKKKELSGKTKEQLYEAATTGQASLDE